MDTVSDHEDMQQCRDRDAMAAKLAALSHPARLKILQHLAEVEACCCKDVVDRLHLAQSTVSQHLKVLVESGLVRFTPDNRRSRYEVDGDEVRALAESVNGLLTSCCGFPAGEDAD